VKLDASIPLPAVGSLRAPELQKNLQSIRIRWQRRIDPRIILNERLRIPFVPFKTENYQNHSLFCLCRTDQLPQDLLIPDHRRTDKKDRKDSIDQFLMI
jgi:hypothetical protein